MAKELRQGNSAGYAVSALMMTHHSLAKGIIDGAQAVERALNAS